MSVVAFLVIWYLMGVLGCIFGVLSDLDKGQNFTLGDLFMAVIVSLLGFFVLLLGFCEYMKNKDGSKFNPVLIKGKGRR